MVCVLSVFFFFLSCPFFFFFYGYFSWQTLRGNHFFLCIPLPPAYKHPFSSSRFLSLVFNQSICNDQIDNWWDLFSCILFAFSLVQLSRSYWLWQFKVTMWGFELISNNTLLLQRERLNQLRLTPLLTAAFLSHLPNPTSSHNLSSIRLSKCIMRDFF